MEKSDSFWIATPVQYPEDELRLTYGMQTRCAYQQNAEDTNADIIINENTKINNAFLTFMGFLHDAFLFDDEATIITREISE